MSPLVVPIDPPGPPWPKVEFSRYRPVPDLTMLAALERAAGHTGHPDKASITRFLGFRFSGAVSRSLEKQLQTLKVAGLVSSRKRRGRQPLSCASSPGWRSGGSDFARAGRPGAQGAPHGPPPIRDFC